MTMTLPPPTRGVIRGRKTFVLSKAEIDDTGTLSGYGAIFDNVDDGGDIIRKGFFADVLGDFLKEGFFSWGHRWDVPCAMPTKAVEDGVGLAIAGKFHSDPESQRYRTIAAERLANGQTMGLSIGYEIAPGGARRSAEGRELLKAKRLFEVGLVMVPMNREAGATDVKTGDKAANSNAWTASYVLSMVLDLIEDEAMGADPEDQGDVTTLGQVRDLVLEYLTSTAREVGTPEDLAEAEAEREAYWGWMGRGLTFAKHQELVENEIKSIVRRANALARPRKEGRVLSSHNRDRLQVLDEALTGAADELKDLLASGPGVTAKGRQAQLDAAVEHARSLGVPI
jgi:hypothetical protein